MVFLARPFKLQINFLNFMCNTKQSQTLGGAILGFSIARTISPPFDDVIFIADVTLVSGDDVITLPLSGSVEGVFER